ncbi:hypothetical protein Thi970DRAFT_02820 [Thiorhodovibrio frisius]|uniref:Uncharacterized protein n=2 Tax=Thiorhodovibrio frisius TaxID=631362 RepID=H8Z1S1_9GAMM|nr:hypothetical protein Thi970DRAFT_02820 [Thiorhodovibrio frisius]WPL19990.1 hypothetical protein Thiofri_00041 [Thiorhodovibrio frisius]
MRLQRREGESDWDFSTRLNQQVFESIYHCDYDFAPRAIERIVGLTPGSKLDQVGFLSPDIVCGFCHQVAFILAKALSNGGLNAKPLGVNGHVVTLAYIDGKPFVLDPDIGVGPIAYGDQMSDEAAHAYKTKLMDSTDQPPSPGLVRYMNKIVEAYATTEDDRPYFTLDWMSRIQIRQQRYILFVTVFAYGIGFLGLLLIFLCAVPGFKRRDT